MKEFILKYWLEAVFGIVITIFGAGYGKLNRKIQEQEAIKLGIQALLRDRIIQQYNHYHDKGFCPIYALENVDAMYLQYHNLGGNGTVTKLVEKLREMPTEKESEESL